MSNRRSESRKSAPSATQDKPDVLTTEKDHTPSSRAPLDNPKHENDEEATLSGRKAELRAIIEGRSDGDAATAQRELNEVNERLKALGSDAAHK